MAPFNDRLGWYMEHVIGRLRGVDKAEIYYTEAS